MNDALLALAGDLLGYWPERELDGGDLQDLLAKHGLIEETQATAEDAEQEWAQEWGIEEGDTCYKLTELGRKARQAVKG